MSSSNPLPLRFEVFEFDPSSGELYRRGPRVKLTPQAKVLLRLLLEMPLRVRTREELQKNIWPGSVFVDFEHGLNKVIHDLRQSLGDKGSNSRFIETVAGQGYRFIPELVQAKTIPANAQKDGAVFSIAVLPICTAGTDPKLQSLSSRITPWLTNAISRVPGLRVLAHGTVKSHNILNASPQSAGKSMGVQAVLSGELILEEANLSLRLELIDVSDGAQLASAFIEVPSDISVSAVRDLTDEIIHQMRLLQPSSGETLPFTTSGPGPVSSLP